VPGADFPTIPSADVIVLQGLANTPPVNGRGAPVVPGKVIGKPRKLRTAR
jgi:hypothetical protein